jgi:EIN3-binding F-box protein
MKDLERPIKRPRDNHGASHVDFISKFPDDCLQHVFSFLPTKKDRMACCAVSKRWFNLQLEAANSNLTKTNQQVTTREVSRNLMGPVFSDLSLAAMLIGINSYETLTSLSLVGQGQPFQSKGCQITDVGISMLTSVCMRLRAISLCNCTRIGNIGIACIAYNCSSLERMELTNPGLVTDEGLTLLLMKCNALLFLSLDTCRHITDRTLEVIAQYATNLKSLELVNLPLVEGSGITSILLTRLQLAALKIESINLSDKVLLSSPQKWSLTELKNIAIKNPGQELTDSGLRCLTRMARMENLYLEGLEFATSFYGLIQILANCRHTLKSLELVRCSTCESKIRVCDCSAGKHNFPRLQSVTLRQCKNIDDEFFPVLGHACRSIREVNLVGLDSITNRGITSFMQNLHDDNKVRKIEIVHCAKIGNPSVWAITRACGRKLKSLIIKHCKLVTDHGIGMIGTRCPKLINLDLGGTRIGDAGVEKIVDARLFYLEELSLRKCTEITDASLAAIANAPFLMSLERVGLSGCTGLSKRGLELFESMAYELI